MHVAGFKSFSYCYIQLFLFLYTGGMIFLMAVSSFNFIFKQFKFVGFTHYRDFLLQIFG